MPFLTTLAALTLRQLFGWGALVAVLGATVGKQTIDYNQLFTEKNISYHNALLLDKQCVGAKQDYPDATDDKGCADAKLETQTGPRLAAFIQLVNTTWPHPTNISNYVKSLWDTYIFYGYLLVLVLFGWPRLCQLFAGCSDVGNEWRFRKAQIEEQKMLQNTMFYSHLVPPPPLQQQQQQYKTQGKEVSPLVQEHE